MTPETTLPRFLLMTASAKMPGSCKGVYRRIAIVETDGTGVIQTITSGQNTTIAPGTPVAFFNEYKSAIAPGVPFVFVTDPMESKDRYPDFSFKLGPRGGVRREVC